MSTNLISHIGTIKSINNQQLIVSITSQTACSSCHAKGGCSSSEQQEKEIEILRWEKIFKTGEEVLVVTSSSQGYKAIIYAYLLPLVLLIAAMITLLSLTGEEVTAALGSLLTLVPYYGLLYFFRDKIKTSFHFTVQKLPNIVQNE